MRGYCVIDRPTVCGVTVLSIGLQYAGYCVIDRPTVCGVTVLSIGLQYAGLLCYR